MEEWKQKLLSNPPSWAKQFSKEEFEHIVINELIQNGFAHASLGGKASALAARENNLECNVKRFAWSLENCSKGGKVSTNSKSRWWFNGSEFKFVKESPGDGWSISAAPNNVGKSTSQTYWWNNGTTHKRSMVCPGDGWFLGRINNGRLGGSRIKGQGK